MTIDEERAVNFFFANLRLKKKVCIREEESADEREKKRRKQKQKQKRHTFYIKLTDALTDAQQSNCLFCF